MAAASRCLWPLPVSFTRKVSDVKPAIKLDFVNAFPKSQSIRLHFASGEEACVFHPGHPNACAIIFCQGINNQVRFRQIIC